MHELSIAKGMLANLEPWLEEQSEDIRIGKIVVRAGPFRAIVEQALEFAWEVVRRENEKLKNSHIELDITRIKVKCNKCGYSTEATRPMFTCKECNSNDLIIEGGDELYISDIEIIKEE